MVLPTRKREGDLEPLTPEQGAAVGAWRDSGCKDSPQVAALRKKARGEPLTDEERALLGAGSSRRFGRTLPHSQVMRELAERQRRGE
jgi:hypothetical protein